MSNALSLQWRAQAACRDADPDLFFPIGSSDPAVTQTEEAKSICRACPVQAACLEWALKSGQDHGIWGGLDEHERAATRRHPEAPVAEQPTQTEQPVAAAPPPDDGVAARRQDVFARRTLDAGDGHREWKGAEPVTVGATRYTARKLSWLIEHGVAPEGKLLVTCGHIGCITATHLQDSGRPATGCGTRNGYLAHLSAGEPACPNCLQANAEQRRRNAAAAKATPCGTTAAYYQHLMAGEPIDPACQAASDRYEQQLTPPPSPPDCGTRGGYQKHLRAEETPCTPCRQANADADRRLRNTGTTLAAA